MKLVTSFFRKESREALKINDDSFLEVFSEYSKSKKEVSGAKNSLVEVNTNVNARTDIEINTTVTDLSVLERCSSVMEWDY